MGNVLRLVPKLTINRQFMVDFIEAEAPCFALGLVEERKKACGFLALRPNVAIPQAVMDQGFRFGHSLMGNDAFEVVHFGFEFYGFGNYNVLLNPNSPLVRTVLNRMVESGDYFFFAIGPDQSVSMFRSEIGQRDIVGLADNLQRINRSSTTAEQYGKAVAQFKRTSDPPGRLLTWVCRDNISYLDLTADRLEMRLTDTADGASSHDTDEPAPTAARPNWQPISMLPQIASIIDGQLEAAREQHAGLLKVRDCPHVLDDQTVQRVIRLYTEQLGFLPFYREQLARWGSPVPTPAQRKEINRLSAQLDRHEPVLKDVLALAKELALGTIDAVMRMADGELGQAVFKGRTKPSRGSSPNEALRVAEQQAIAEMLDAHIVELENAGVSPIDLFPLMAPQMPLFQRLMEIADERFLSELDEVFPGLYRYGKVLEQIAERIRSGDIRVPR